MSFIHSDSVTWVKRIPFDYEPCEIWEAIFLDKDQGRKVYVRKFGPFSTNEHVERFRKVASDMIAKGSKCRNVSHFYGLFAWDAYVCIVSVPFEDLLSKLIQYNSRVSIERIRKYCSQLCTGIANLHENGLHVGDFNPTNVSIDKDDNCFLTDLGFCKEFFMIQNSISSRGGSYYHFSPEAVDAAQFGGVSVKTDSWNFALMMIEMCTGSRPWAEVDRIVFERLIMNGEIPEIPSLPEPLKQLTLRCLSFEPLDRPNFQDMLPAFSRQWPPASVKDDCARMKKIIGISEAGDACPLSTGIEEHGKIPLESPSTISMLKKNINTGHEPMSMTHTNSLERSIAMHYRDSQLVQMKHDNEGMSVPLVPSGTQCTLDCLSIGHTSPTSDRVQVQEHSVALSRDDIQQLRELQSEWKTLRSSFAQQLQAARQEKQDAERVMDAHRVEYEKLKGIVERKDEALELLSRNSQEFESIVNKSKAECEMAKEACFRLMESNRGLTRDIQLLRAGLNSVLHEISVAANGLRTLEDCQDECCRAHSASVRERARLQIEVDRLMLFCQQCEENSKCEQLRGAALQNEIAELKAENRKMLNMFEAEQNMCATSTGYIERLLQKVANLEGEIVTLKVDLKAGSDQVTKEQDQYAMHKKIWETEKALLVSKNEEDSNQRRKLACDDPLMEIAFEKFAKMCCASMSILRRCKGSNSERRALVIDSDVERRQDQIYPDLDLSNDFYTEVQELIASAMISSQTDDVNKTTGCEMAKISALASAARVNGRPQQAEALYQLAILSYRIQEEQKNFVKSEGENRVQRDRKAYAETEQNLPVFPEQKALSGNPSVHVNNDKTQFISSSGGSSGTLCIPNETSEYTSLNPAAVPAQCQIQHVHSCSTDVQRASSLRSFPSSECSPHPVSSSSGSLRQLPTDTANVHRSPFRSNYTNDGFPKHYPQQNPGDVLCQRENLLQEHMQDKKLVLGLVLDGDSILKVFPGSLSYLAGLKEGDVITSINDKVVNARTAVHVLREVTDQVSQNHANPSVRGKPFSINLSVHRSGTFGSMRCNITGSLG